VISVDPLALAGAKPRGARPWFHNDPAVERVLAITMALAGEVAVMHERLDTIERLLSTGAPFDRGAIETYTPDGPAEIERQRWHAEFVARILRVVQQEMEALEQDPKYNRSVAEIGEELGRM
jgi:hypothetical protein